MYCCLVIVSYCSCSINYLFHGLLSNYSVWLSHAQRYYIWRRGFSETSQALMATQYGRLREFHPETDTIKAYLERVDLYFAANEVAEDKRVPILLSSIGPSTYSLLSDLTAPASPGSKTLQQIGDLLRGYYEPKRSVIAERFHFHKREQATGETIKDFDATLRRLATHCEFGATLEDTLRDRFICGLRHETIQRRLLSEKDLTYTKALDLARAMESADSQMKAFKSTEPAIHQFTPLAPKTQTKTPCYR